MHLKHIASGQPLRHHQQQQDDNPFAPPPPPSPPCPLLSQPLRSHQHQDRYQRVQEPKLLVAQQAVAEDGPHGGQCELPRHPASRAGGDGMAGRLGSGGGGMAGGGGGGALLPWWDGTSEGLPDTHDHHRYVAQQQHHQPLRDIPVPWMATVEEREILHQVEAQEMNGREDPFTVECISIQYGGEEEERGSSRR